MKRILASFVMLLGLMSPVALGTNAGAVGAFDAACKDNPSSVICKQTGNADTKTNKFVQNVISTLLFALGIIAVIVIIVGGIRYATSDGDSSKVKQAKDTILYAVVGLVVALISYGIVNFVIDRF